MVERENRLLRSAGAADLAESTASRKSLLPRLAAVYKKLKEVGSAWQELAPAERQQYPELSSLMRQNQDRIMKVVVLDRENEQAMLRRGLIPPAQLPSFHQQRPASIAALYEGQSE